MLDAVLSTSVLLTDSSNAFAALSSSPVLPITVSSSPASSLESLESPETTPSTSVTLPTSASTPSPSSLSPALASRGSFESASFNSTSDAKRARLRARLLTVLVGWCF